MLVAARIATAVTASGLVFASEAQSVFDLLTAVLAFFAALFSVLEIRRRRRRRSTRPHPPSPNATKRELDRYHAELEQWGRDQDEA